MIYFFNNSEYFIQYIKTYIIGDMKMYNKKSNDPPDKLKGFSLIY